MNNELFAEKKLPNLCSFCVHLVFVFIHATDFCLLIDLNTATDYSRIDVYMYYNSYIKHQTERKYKYCRQYVNFCSVLIDLLGNKRHAMLPQFAYTSPRHRCWLYMCVQCVYIYWTNLNVIIRLACLCELLPNIVSFYALSRKIESRRMKNEFTKNFREHKLLFSFLDFGTNEITMQILERSFSFQYFC